MRIHTYTPLHNTDVKTTKRIKYKIWDFGDMCTIAYSSSHVESYRFVDRREEDGVFTEVLEKLPIGYTPPSDVAICSVVDIGLTENPSVFIYGNYLLTVSTAAQAQPTRSAKEVVKPKATVRANPTHTRQFKRQPLREMVTASVGIPLVMPPPPQQQQPQVGEEHPRKIKPRVPMMSIPLIALPAATE